MLSKYSKLVVALVAFAIVASGIYYFLRVQEHWRPEIPEPNFKAVDIVVSQENLTNRVATLAMDGELGDFADRIAQLHQMETQSPNSLGKAYKEALAGVEQEAATLASRRPKDYIILGDLLALSFQKSLYDALAVLKKNGWGDKFFASREFGDVQSKGGLFINRAFDSGLIGEDGRLQGPDILPQVLFRVRWRHIARFELDQGFEPVERAAFNYFTARFGARADSSRRLEALNKLSQYDPGYDVDLAAAVMLFELGDVGGASKIIQNVQGTGRDEEALQRFSKMLEEQAPRKKDVDP